MFYYYLYEIHVWDNLYEIIINLIVCILRGLFKQLLDQFKCFTSVCRFVYSRFLNSPRRVGGKLEGILHIE